jgi:hypothetical protein
MPSETRLPLPATAAAEPVPSAFVIEVAGRQAGLALREARGFRFLAADPAFRTLDGSRFPSLPRLREAASHLAGLQRAA